MLREARRGEAERERERRGKRHKDQLTILRRRRSPGAQRTIIQRRALPPSPADPITARETLDIELQKHPDGQRGGQDTKLWTREMSTTDKRKKDARKERETYGIPRGWFGGDFGR